MERKKLVLIATFILIILIIVVITLVFSNSPKPKEDEVSYQTEFQRNTEILNEHNENIFRYGDDAYLLDEKLNTIIKMHIATGENKELFHFPMDEYSRHFFVRCNQLFFSYGNVTYYTDLDCQSLKDEYGAIKEYTNLHEFCAGEVVYMNDEVCFIINHKSYSDELFVTTYDSKTLRTTNLLTHSLAEGKAIQFLKAENDCLYFTSQNVNETISLFEVDLTNNKVTIITRMPEYDYDNVLRNEYADVLKAENDYYFVVRKLSDIISIAGNGEILEDCILYYHSTEGNFDDLYTAHVGEYLAYSKDKRQSVLYEMNKDGSFVWRDTGTEEVNGTWEDFVYGDVTKYFSIHGNDIAKNGEKWIETGTDLTDSLLQKVIRLENGFYFEIVNNVSYHWYFCDTAGNHWIRLY